MTEEKYYKPCSTCHNADCVWAGGQDTHKKCEGYQSLEQGPCEDCVSREFMYKLGAQCIAVRNENGELVAIAAIENLPPVQPKVAPIAEIRFDDDKLHEIVDEAIKNIEIKYEWIPVTERLPEDRRPVLVTAYWHETYQVMQASYFGKGLWWCVPFNNTGEHEQKLDPRAWMPLPEPYKESEDL